MHSHRLLSMLAALALASVASGQANANNTAERTETFVGYAYAQDSEELLYSEHHEREWQADKPVRMQTRYRLPNGETFAERSVEYLDGGRVSFELQDQRTGYLEGADIEADEVKLFVRRSSDGTREADTVSLGEDLIIDAGFDSYVRQHFDRLLASEKVQARFAVPSRQSAYDCEIRKIEELEIDGQPAVTLRLRFKGFLLSLFADPVDVTYHRDTGQLMRYVGVSNVRDEQGENYQVRIELPLNERGDAS